MWQLFEATHKSARPDLWNALEAEYGATTGWSKSKWDKSHTERLARDGEKFLATGSASSPEAQEVFSKWGQWMSEVYGDLESGPLKGKLSPAAENPFPYNPRTANDSRNNL